MSNQVRGEDPGDLRSQLRTELKAAIRARDRLAAGSIRVALAAIDNAEAQPIGTESQTERHLAAPSAVDVPRREIDEAAALAIVIAETRELRDAASGFEALGNQEAARNAALQADVLDAIIANWPTPAADSTA